MHLAALVLALVLSSIAVPMAVDAQQAQRLYRIGMLQTTSMTVNAGNIDADSCCC